MSKREPVASVTVRIDCLIVQLQNILRSIQWRSAVRVHGQVRHRLVGKKIGRTVELCKPAYA